VTVRTGVTRAAIGLLTAGLLPLTVAVPAEATNYAYDGKDPIATGCANDATTKALSHLNSGGDWSEAYVELRYSLKCHTAWARLSNAYGPDPGNFTGGYALIHRNSDLKQYRCDLVDAVEYTSCYTAMVYDKDPITSSAYGFDHDWKLRHWVGAWTSPY